MQEKIFHCHECDKRYHTAKRLKLHFEANHIPTKCKICGTEFKNKRSCAVHEVTCQMSEERKQEWKNKLKIKSTGRGHTIETRKKLSEIQLKFLQENPHMVPYRLYHSSKWSYPERVFRKALIDHKIENWHYNYDFGIYQLDFGFPEIKLDVEIDGPTHRLENVIKKDKRRDEWVKFQGWKVLRFTTDEVMKNLDQCINTLISYITIHL